MRLRPILHETGRTSRGRGRYRSRISPGPPVADLERAVLDPSNSQRLVAVWANHRPVWLGARGCADRRAVFASDDGHGGRAGGAGDAHTPLRMTALANLVNVVLAYGLIYGHFGLPAMGVVGSAWATFLARSLALV